MASSPTRQHLDLVRVTRRCESQKVCFLDYAEAHTAAERLMDLGKVLPGCHISPYECDRCSYWHVANKKVVFPKFLTDAPKRADTL